MKNEKLLNAIGEIRDAWIADARESAVRRRSLRRLPVLAAAVILLMALTVSALAVADVEGVYDVLYAISPAIAQTLKPVRVSCVDNGIELEVISADIEADSAKIYLGLRDLEGGRVDDTTDLFDSYRIHMSGNFSATCSYSHYDESTQTALFLVEIWPDGGKIDKNKLTFSLSRFISGKQEFAGLLELDPAEADTAPATRTDVVTRGYGWMDDSWADFTVDKFLVPEPILSPMEGVCITGMGWVDGYLHIQTRYENILETDAHGGVSLFDEEGNSITDVYVVSYWDDADKGSSYSEQIFAVSPEALENCRLMGVFYSADTLVEGHWEVTFPVREE